MIARYRNPGFEAVADGVMDFFDKRPDLYRDGISFGSSGSEETSKQPAKVSTDISLVSLDRSDPQAFAMSEVIIRGVNAALEQYLKERPLFRECCPEQSLFVNPIFNLQRYAPSEGFISWHCDWTTSEELTEPVHRVLAWILYCNSIDSAGTEFFWQKHHEEAERGKLILFPAGLSHIHRGRVNHFYSKTIATGWINSGTQEAYISRLSKSGI